VRANRNILAFGGGSIVGVLGGLIRLAALSFGFTPPLPTGL